MKENYDFSKGVKNPYAKQLKRQVTINLNSEVVQYFKAQADVTGIPYQTLINLYLKDCVDNKRKLETTWK